MIIHILSRVKKPRLSTTTQMVRTATAWEKHYNANARYRKNVEQIFDEFGLSDSLGGTFPATVDDLIDSLQSAGWEVTWENVPGLRTSPEYATVYGLGLRESFATQTEGLRVLSVVNFLGDQSAHLVARAKEDIPGLAVHVSEDHVLLQVF